jgi:hypothetical protein
MTFGVINEWSTYAAYDRLLAQTNHPELKPRAAAQVVPEPTACRGRCCASSRSAAE